MARIFCCVSNKEELLSVCPRIFLRPFDDTKFLLFLVSKKAVHSMLECLRPFNGAHFPNKGKMLSNFFSKFRVEKGEMLPLPLFSIIDVSNVLLWSKGKRSPFFSQVFLKGFR